GPRSGNRRGCSTADVPWRAPRASSVAPRSTRARAVLLYMPTATAADTATLGLVPPPPALSSPPVSAIDDSTLVLFSCEMDALTTMSWVLLRTAWRPTLATTLL